MARLPDTVTVPPPFLTKFLMPVRLDKLRLMGELLARVALPGNSKADVDASQVRMLGLMRDVLARICEQAAQLQDRVEELAAMYRVTEVFAGKRHLKEVHQLAAETMVRVSASSRPAPVASSSR